MAILKNVYYILINGSSELSINSKRNYYANIPTSPKSACKKRWRILGERLRSSAEKVVNNAKP